MELTGGVGEGAGRGPQVDQKQENLNFSGILSGFFLPFPPVKDCNFLVFFFFSLLLKQHSKCDDHDNLVLRFLLTVTIILSSRSHSLNNCGGLSRQLLGDCVHGNTTKVFIAVIECIHALNQAAKASTLAKTFFKARSKITARRLCAQIKPTS